MAFILAPKSRPQGVTFRINTSAQLHNEFQRSCKSVYLDHRDVITTYLYRVNKGHVKLTDAGTSDNLQLFGHAAVYYPAKHQSRNFIKLCDDNGISVNDAVNAFMQQFVADPITEGDAHYRDLREKISTQSNRP